MSDNLIKPKKNRSTSYPFVDLEHAIELMEKLLKSSGNGPYSRESAALGIGHPKVSGSASMKIATLVHFGLLSRSGNVYSKTALIDRILVHTSDDDRTEAIIESLNSPKLYKTLIDKYSGQAIPTLLENILVREYGININVAKDVYKNFINSLIYSGQLNNGILTSTPMVSENNHSESKAEPEIVKVSKNTSDHSSNPIIDYTNKPERKDVMYENNKHEYSLRDNKKIFISYPEDFTLEEAKSIKSFAEYLISMRSVDQT